MSQYFPSAPSIDDGSFYDVEIENIPYNHELDISSNLVVEINDNGQTTCAILHRILYLLCLSSLTFIIYEHHQTIGIYLIKIGDIF
jgi:hypothetical protein